MNKLSEVNSHEQVFNKLWTECQHCQVSTECVLRALDSKYHHLAGLYLSHWITLTHRLNSFQGSFHQEVLCSNRDCPIFYKRKKVQIDLQTAQDSLDRFNW